MGTIRSSGRTRIGGLWAACCLLALTGCPSPYELRHENQWNAQDQIWMSDASQVRVRAAQSRVFDTKDTRKVLEAVVATLQDVAFKIEVLDETLGIISAKRYVAVERPGYQDPSYIRYQPDTLLMLTRNDRTWGPFWNRNDLVRFTVTVRPRGESQLVVRASAQFYLQAVESPEIYQPFFRALEQTLFLQAHAAP